MIFVVLPAFNEEAGLADLFTHIARTCRDLLPGFRCTVVLVDDGSTDDTVKVAEEVSQQLSSSEQCCPSFVILKHGQNRGLAEALKTGLGYAIDLADPHDVIFTMDSDNSHTPGLMPLMIQRVHEGFDVVIASRYQTGAVIVGLSVFRRFLSFGASLLLRGLFPIHGVRDYTCGFRAFRARILKEAFAENEHFISEKGFAVTADILLKLRRQRKLALMNEVPLVLRYDQKLSSSKMNISSTVRQTLRLIARRFFGAI